MPPPEDECVELDVQPKSVTIGGGKTASLAAQCRRRDGTTRDVTASADTTWSSSDESVATVSAGVVTGVLGGATTITATHAGKSDTADVTVHGHRVISVQITPATATLVPGGTQQLIATANWPDGTAEDVTTTATWSSSDGSVATVDSKGLATAVAEGTATITAEYGGKSGSAAVVVVDQVVSLAVSPSTATIGCGTTQQFHAQGTTQAGDTVDLTGQATWTSADISVATMDSANPGLATGAAEGTTTITATFGSLVGTATLHVTEPTVSSVQVVCSPTSIACADTVQCTANAVFDNGSNQDVTASAAWQSSDKNVADFVTGTAGELEALNPGTTDITATFDGVTSAPVGVTVGGGCLGGLVVTPATAGVGCGTQQFQATCTMASGGVQNVTSQATWASSDPNVATIDATTGLATGVAAGTTTITATYGGLQATATLTVIIDGIISLVIAPLPPHTAPITTYKGDTFKLKATGADAVGNSTDLTAQVTWTIAPTTYVGPGATPGEFVGIAVGTGTQIYASFTPLCGFQVNSNAIAVTVTTGPSPLALTISAEPSYVGGGTVPAADAQYPAGGFELQLVAVMTYTDGSESDFTKMVSWSLKGTPTHGTIDAAGLFTTGSPTTAQVQTVEAKTGTFFVDTFDIAVVPGAITSVAIVDSSGGSPATSVAVGATTSYAAQVTLAGGSTYWATRNVTWVSSDPAKAAIVASGPTAGQLTALAQGTTDISASRGIASSGPLAVTLAPKTATKVWCEPKTGVSVAVGGTAQLKALVQYQDGSTLDLTPDAANISWASDDPYYVDLVSPSTLPGLVVGKHPTLGTYVAPTHTPSGLAATGSGRCLVVVQ